MKYAYYPGCSLHSTAKEYDRSLHTVCEKVGIELKEVKDWICCGSSWAHTTSKLLSLALPLKNLAEIEKSGFREVIVPCVECFSRFKVAQHETNSEPQLAAEVEEVIEHKFKDGVKVSHPLEIFSMFDRLAERYGLEKIKTIGDAYMAVAGLPKPRSDHVEAAANMALHMLEEIELVRTKTGKPFRMRIGMNTGPVIAGVIGAKKFTYDLWGDTVNTASRLESNGVPSGILVLEDTYLRLREYYSFRPHGRINLKGKGEKMTYVLTGAIAL